MTRKEAEEYGKHIAINCRADSWFVYYTEDYMPDEIYDFFVDSENIPVPDLIHISKKLGVKMFYFDMTDDNDIMTLVNHLFSRENILIPFEIISKFKEYYLTLDM